jgi:hypothetical protein
MTVRIAHNRREIAAGTRFGEWTVLRVSGLRGKKRSLHYECLCSCGASVPVNGDSLRRGITKRCYACWLQRNRLRPYESLFNATRTSAQNNNNPKQRTHLFTLSYEEFLTLIEAPLSWAPYMKRSTSMAYQIDRKDNNLGYIPGNVVACCQRCNYGKSSLFTYEEWITMTECFRRLS